MYNEKEALCASGLGALRFILAAAKGGKKGAIGAARSGRRVAPASIHQKTPASRGPASSNGLPLPHTARNRRAGANKHEPLTLTQ